MMSKQLRAARAGLTLCMIVLCEPVVRMSAKRLYIATPACTSQRLSAACQRRLTCDHVCDRSEGEPYVLQRQLTARLKRCIARVQAGLDVSITGDIDATPLDSPQRNDTGADDDAQHAADHDAETDEQATQRRAHH